MLDSSSEAKASRVIICKFPVKLLGLRSVMTTALDSDERLHSEVGLKQERTRQRTHARRR